MVLLFYRAFCNPADVEAFTEEKKQTLLVKRQGKGADFVRAVQEIIDSYEKLKKQEQVDDLNSGTEVTAANGGNSVESFPNLQLKDISEAPAEASDAQSKFSNLKIKTDSNENNLPGKEAIVATQVGDSHVKPEVKEPVLEEQTKDRPVICTYSLRKKSGGSQFESSMTRRRASSVRRSRSSSKQESSGFENLTVPCKDSEKGAAVVSSNSAQDGSSRKSRRTKKTPDISKGDDRDSPAFVQNGSIEDNGSEIVSMESDSISLNDGSAADSSCKHEQYETVIDCVEAEAELRKGLDLQINAVLKKKRKPNRKRVLRDAAEPTTNADNGAATDTVNSAGQDSESTLVRAIESCPKDDGDEHLPLLKRARVRMGKLLSQEDENNSITSSEEKVLKDVPENSSALNHNSSCEEKVLKEVKMNALGCNENNISYAEEETTKKSSVHASLNSPSVNHAEEEITKKGSVHVSLSSSSVNHDPVSPCMKKETSDGVSISEDCTECSDQRPLWKLNKNQPYVSSADGEAALPPSKRLHRALEAMSANAAQECPSSSGVLLIVQPTTSSCISSQSSPHIAIACEIGNAARHNIPDSISNHVSHVMTSLSPSHLNQKSLSESNMVEEMDICQHPTERPESPMQAEEIASVRDEEDARNVCISTSDDPVGDSLMETQTTKQLSPEIEVTEPALRFNQVLHDPSCTVGETHAVNVELNSKEESVEKHPGPSEKTARSPCAATEIEKIAAVSPGHGIDAQQKSSECNSENGGNEHLRLQCQDSNQDNTMCHGNETRHDQILRNSKDVSCSNGHLDDGDIPISSRTDGIHSSPGASQHNTAICHTCNSDEDRSKNSRQDNGSCSPIETSQLSNSAHDAADSDGKVELSVTPPTSVGKHSNYSEAHAALSSFEAVLGTLTRTKESIGRATRIALDCAKHGFASKAFEVLARSLENESSLYRRVDIFFLVDSIMQCSRGLKGDAGGGYPSLIQGALPRLLSAAAPTGSSAHENRRQCLKVLRLWLERRFLPDSILRHHMRDLDVFSGPSSVNPYARRSSRNERAFDDPVREMEGMLVDEYGSNSSFQLPGFCMPRMLKDGDEGSDSDSDGSFEAVTPEHTTPGSPQQETTSTMGKHRHILQDVDGELEMEDVAPSEGEMVSTENSQNIEQRFPPPPHAAPALPVLPPSPQPISPLPPPPPPPPPPLNPPHPIASGVSDCHVNGLHQTSHASVQNVQGNMGPPHPPVPPRADQRNFSGSHYHNSESRDPPQQMPMPDPPNHAYNRRSMENGEHEDGSRFNNGRGYQMRPPYAPPSNHFSYGQSDQRGRPRRDGPPPYSGRIHHQHNRGNGNYHHNNHERMKPPPYEVRDNWRFSSPYSGEALSFLGCSNSCLDQLCGRFPPFSFFRGLAADCCFVFFFVASGPRYPEKGKSSCAPGPYGGPPCEPERFPNHGWSSYPPRPMGHRNHMPYRPHYEGPGYWRPR
ncbi:hypothetical protein CRG98_009101 [Punica granatum]|uniref:CID domain-containing protein n=1 Tax=Punica granatum TaxID=22663 RepID=A0A2I0KRX8_PUNGR|nr:hypothetical protein CRG98_009101 [Punica granatum]